MKHKIESIVSTNSQTSLQNELTNTQRIIKQLKSQYATLKKVNDIQLNALDQLNGDTDYQGQIVRTTNEINHYKQ